MFSRYKQSTLLGAATFLLTFGGIHYPACADVDVNTTAETNVGAPFILSLAESGRASAQSLLGEMHLNGEGVPMDYAKALKWFRAAARQGDPASLMRLGHMYESGLGVKRDLAQAEVWYRRAAQCGDLLSSYRFGLNYKGLNIP